MVRLVITVLRHTQGLGNVVPESARLCVNLPAHRTPQLHASLGLRCSVAMQSEQAGPGSGLPFSQAPLLLVPSSCTEGEDEGWHGGMEKDSIPCHLGQVAYTLGFSIAIFSAIRDD